LGSRGRRCREAGRAYRGRELHIVLDNVSTHKTPDIREWLAKHPRITFHFTPTSASWMNHIETWFGILTRQAIRRSSFTSVKWNEGGSPFTWVKTADQILAKAASDQRIGTLGHRDGRPSCVDAPIV
jgi:hypothetical protein